MTKIYSILLVVLIMITCKPKSREKGSMELQKAFFLDMKKRNSISFSGDMFYTYRDTLTQRAIIYIGANVIEKSTGANFGNMQTELEATWDNKNQKYILKDRCEICIGWYGIFDKFNPLRNNVLSNFNGQMIIEKNMHIEEDNGEFIVSHTYELASHTVDFNQIGLDVRNLADSTRPKVQKNYGGSTCFEMLQVFDAQTLNLLYQETNLASNGEGFDYYSLPGFANKNLESIAFTNIFWKNANSSKSNNFSNTGLMYETKNQLLPSSDVHGLKSKYQHQKELKEKLTK